MAANEGGVKDDNGGGNSHIIGHKDIEFIVKTRF